MAADAQVVVVPDGAQLLLFELDEHTLGIGVTTRGDARAWRTAIIVSFLDRISAAAEHGFTPEHESGEAAA
jgi:hypothetical protein